MWIRINPNPDKRDVGDCVIRAIAIALGMSWEEVYDDLYRLGRREHDMMSSNELWGLYLYQHGFEPFLLPESCPECITVREFAKRFPRGRYIVGTGTHAIAVIHGNYMDTWDSGDTVPAYFWRVA